MKKSIANLPAIIAFIALSPLFATFLFAFIGNAPAVMHTERFALLIFQGCIPTAAACFAVAMFSLIYREVCPS